MNNYSSPITFGPGDQAEMPEEGILPPDLLELFDYSIRAAKLSLDSPTRGGSGLWLLVSLVVFVLTRLGGGGFELSGIVLLIGVLFLHESGHFLGMKLFGYRNVTMFFIPFFGAAVSGKKHAVAAWKEIIVLLLGPLPGLLLGAALYFILWPTDTKSVAFQAISMLLILNAFNLLPFMPLDGGRIMNLLIFRRHPILEVLFKLFAVAGLALSAFLFFSWILGVVAVLTLFSIPFGYNLATRARKLRKDLPAISAEWDELGLRELQSLFLQAVEILPPDRVPANVGKRMLLLHEQASSSSPGFLATLFFLVVYGVSFFIGPTVGVVMVLNQPKVQPATQLCDEAEQLLEQARALQPKDQEPAPLDKFQSQSLAKQADEKLQAASRLLLDDARFGQGPPPELMLRVGQLRQEAALLSGRLDHLQPPPGEPPPH